VKNDKSLASLHFLSFLYRVGIRKRNLENHVLHRHEKTSLILNISFIKRSFELIMLGLPNIFIKEQWSMKLTTKWDLFLLVYCLNKTMSD
jgi:hypothetical protein